MSLIAIKNISKKFSRPVLKGVTFNIKKGEFVVLCGKNGSGKTTLLHIIAGILEQDKGSITARKTVGYVFQNYQDSLLPWKTNLDNIAFPLELAGVRKEERCKKARALVKEVGLHIPLLQYPYQSSGGEQQIVAFLREVITQPEIILMDEPFSALHYETREYLKLQVQKMWKKLGLTILFVSHDIQEAIQLADRVLLMQDGRTEKEYDIEMQRPRTERIVQTAEFLRIKKRIGRDREQK